MTNSGSVAIALTQGTGSTSSFYLTGNNPTLFSTSNTCGTSLAVGASCTITLTFHPTGLTSNSSAYVRVSSDATLLGNLTGNGNGVAPAATLTGNGVFGTQARNTTSTAHTFTYTNTGSGPITVAGAGTPGVGLSGTNANQFAISANTCTGVTLQAGGTCSVSVTFHPTSTGNKSATLTVRDTAGGAANQPLALTGTGN
jgi:hypothetical protein